MFPSFRQGPLVLFDGVYYVREMSNHALCIYIILYSNVCIDVVLWGRRKKNLCSNRWENVMQHGNCTM